MKPSSINIFAYLAVALVATIQAPVAHATDLDIADLPLFVTASMPPNVLLTLDDSGSMAWGYVPDGLDTNQGTKRFKAANFNAIYYNPTVTYTPPPKYNGGNCKLDNTNPSTCYPNVSFTDAPINGFDTSRGTVNLSSNYRVTLEYNPNNSSQTFASSPSSGGRAFYYLFDSTNASCDGTKSDEDCYDYYDVTTLSATAQQNFANWYSYYRTRNLATVSAAMNGFAGLSGSIRVAWQAINSCNSFGTSCNGWGSPGQSIDNRIRRLNAVTHTETTNTILSSNTTTTHYSYTCTAKFNSSNSGDRIELSSCTQTSPVAGTGFPPTSGQGSPANATLGLVTASCSNVTYCKNYYTTGTSINSGVYRINVPNSIASDSSNISNVVISWNETVTTTVYETRDVTHKEDLFNWLSRFPASGGTYLLKAANNAGKYFQGTVNINHPYAEDPQILDGNHYACRRSVHLMMTDGSWCGDAASDYAGIGDTNSTATSVPLGPDGSSNYSWTPSFPFRDKQATNLSDVAFYYWAQDLQTGIDNKLSPLIREASTNTDLAAKKSEEWFNPKNDPATWQHLNTYSVGLGLSGSLVSPYPNWGGNTYTGDYDKLVAGTSCPTSTTSSSSPSQSCWPYTANGESCAGYVASTPSKIYDLWHAAISGRGKFFGTESAADLVDAFNSILHEVADESMTAAALAANSTGLQTTTLLYQAQFDPSDWSGHFYARPINPTTGLPLDSVWDAATLIPDPDVRKQHIFTYNGTNGILFDSCSTLNSSQQSALNGTDNSCTNRLNWLRGYTISDFRKRKNTLLGDIVNSDPYFVKNTDFGFTALPSGTAGQSTYATYIADNIDRTPMVYVGANDGMLHGFQADTGQTNSGKEIFAYIPAGVYGQLSALTSPDYNHRYFVDSGPLASDAYLSGSWKTVLVGGLGKGGKTIYALDVTDPTNFSQTNVMWEFPNNANLEKDSTIATDLGYTYSQPQIGLLRNGTNVIWAAIFGNGYNSSSGRAFLFIVNLSNGDLIKKIETNSETSNGLSTPYLLDADGDKVIDAVYAGDLQGNLWKFDLSGENSTAWGLGNGGAALFTAVNSANQRQPITSQPLTGGHPDGGFLVYFGTGSYITTTDASNTDGQTFYGIWDKPSTSGTVSRSALQSQTIVTTTTAFGSDIRLTTSNTVDWSSKRGWYLDLSVGERVNSAPLIRYGRVIFATTIPKSDPCESGGTTWLNEIDLITGGAPTASSFDLNNDKKFDDSDKVKINGVLFSVTGLQSTVGIAKAPIWLESNDSTKCVAFKEMSGSSGEIMTIANNCGSGSGTGSSGTVKREYWIQIQ